MGREWSTLRPQGDLSESEWTGYIRRLIGEGQCFLAYDHALDGLKAFPDSRRLRLLGALGLVRAGALNEARRMLAPIGERLEAEEPLAREVLARLGGLGRLLTEAEPEAQLKGVAALAAGIVKLGSSVRFGESDDRDTLHLLAELYFEFWRADRLEADLRRSRDLNLQSLRAFGDRECGIHAATGSWLLGERALARELARSLQGELDHIDPQLPAIQRFQGLTTLGEVLLLGGEGERAAECYLTASTLPGVGYAAVAAARERIGLLADYGLTVPDAILAALPQPVIVEFAGQGLDYPGQAEPIFPPHAEEWVGRAIRSQLESLDPDIGYCSAACGSDLLFIEAMLEREAEVHLLLPCAVEDFIKARVAYAGPRWVRRFRTALKLATSVSLATEERFLGHEVLYRFNNQIIDGMARLRAELLGTSPHLVLVWDYAVESRAGTAADFMDQWADIARLRLIDLDEVRSQAQAAALPPDEEEPPASPGEQAVEPERVIRAMLFADIVGFSKLREEELPGLWKFVAEIKARTEVLDCAPDLIESWGDALYVVMPSARELLRYAFLLQECFQRLDPLRFGLSQPLKLRVGLHAGPVYEGTHPLTGKPIIYGSHVSRTARIEPVTVPGQIYGSQQFVALLRAEESRIEYESEMMGADYRRWFVCEYLGTQQLAKNYGAQPVYHLRPRRSGEAAG